VITAPLFAQKQNYSEQCGYEDLFYRCHPAGEMSVTGIFMDQVLIERLEQLQVSGIGTYLAQALHGIEKEGLRVNGDSGKISLTHHPESLGAALTNKYITTDFSESLLELITPALPGPDAALEFLWAIHHYVSGNLGEELIWAASMPCWIDDGSMIPIARYGSSNLGRMKYIYRLGLQHRYGKMMQSIAGIHYNYSLPSRFWPSYQELVGNDDPVHEFTSSAYFAMMRNFRRHSWLLLFLFGASPVLSRSFLGGIDKGFETLSDDALFLPWATSLRMSDLGYSNASQSTINICFNTLRTYINTLAEAINTTHPDYQRIGVKVDGEYRQLSDTVLQIENEYYSDIRPKRVPEPGESALQALNRGGVEYVEIRSTDVNPLLPLGIDGEQARFMETFLLTCLLMGDTPISPEECDVIAENHKRVTTRGREPLLELTSLDGDHPLKEAGLRLLRQCDHTAELLDDEHTTTRYSQSVAAQRAKIEEPALTPSARIIASLKSSGLRYNEWVLELSKQHKHNFLSSTGALEPLHRIAAEAEQSLARQAEIEARDAVDFDTFLRSYRTHQIGINGAETS
jgi:glutamate--cysteine ligase